MKLFEILTYVGGAIGALLLFAAFFGANGAPQEAAGAALAIGVVGIPYCITSVLQRAALIRQGQPPA